MAIGSILSGAADIQNSLVNVYNAYQQKKNYDYQKSLQNKMFDREDNSIQRRVADLRAAGLSPVLAAGQGASAGPVVATTAPQIGQMPDMSDAVNIFYNLMKMKADISKTEAETDYINLQKKKTIADTHLVNLNSKEKSLDVNTQYQTGVPGSSMPGKIFNDVTGATTKAVDTLVNSGRSIYDSAQKSLIHKQTEPASKVPVKGWFNNQFKQIQKINKK